MAPAEARAWRAGAGEADVDSSDADMVDAALLATPDGMGGTLWHPSRLEDIHALPPRVLALYFAYRAGAAHAANKKEQPVEKKGEIGGKKVG